MELLSRVACYFRWTARIRSPPSEDVQQTPYTSSRADTVNIDESGRFSRVVESILFWESTVNSVIAVVVFNILFWGIVVSEVRGFAAASSVALVLILCSGSLEAQLSKANGSFDTETSRARAEKIERIGRQLESSICRLKELRRDQPGVFCTVVCSFSVGLWIVGRTINGAILAYALCTGVLIGPALLLRLPGGTTTQKESDSEMEDFLPMVTEDCLQVLKRAGDSGDHSPTPTSAMSDVPNDFFNDDDITDLKMPSHEDGSTDGVELSELELSTGDNDIEGIAFQTGHFEKGSSSEEEAELGPRPRKIISHTDESDSDFEIIDRREVDNLSVS